MKLLFQLVISIALIIIFSNNIASQNVRAVWMYGFGDWHNKYGEIENHVTSAFAMNFNQIYLGVNSDHFSEEAYVDSLISFISNANSKGMSVHAITLQNPHFALDYKHGDALDRIEVILNYNNNNPSAAFEGIQIDPEPHILTESAHSGHSHLFWTTNSEAAALALVGDDINALEPSVAGPLKTRRADIMNQYLSLLQQIRTLIDSQYPGLIFSSTIGWWYNEKSIAPNGYLPSSATAMNSHLDVLAPMVYGGIGWDAADIASRVDDEIGIANAPTIIGISIDELGSFENVQTTIDELTIEFEGDPDFEGIAVFDYKRLIAPCLFSNKIISSGNQLELHSCECIAFKMVFTLNQVQF